MKAVLERAAGPASLQAAPRQSGFRRKRTDRGRTSDHFFLCQEVLQVGSTCRNMACGKMHDGMLNDEEGLADMNNLGRNMAFVLRRLAL